MKRFRLLVLSCILLAACGDAASRDPVSPRFAPVNTASTPAGCAQPDSAAALINALMPKGDRSSTKSRYDFIVRKGGDAQNQAMQLVEFILNKFYADQLIGGQSPATQAKAIALLNAVLCAAGLPQSFGPGSLGNDNAAAVIFPTTPDTNVVTGTGWAGVNVPQGSVTVPTLITVTRLNGTGPLATQLDQYPLFYEYSSSPVQTFAQNLTVGVCLASNATPPDPTRLRVAHNVASGGIEIAPIAPAPFIDCTNADVAAATARSFMGNLAHRGFTLVRDIFGPAPLYAFAGSGVGGTVRTFSPFGLVDTLAIMTRESPSPTDIDAPVIAPPAIRITTPLGRPMVGIPVTFVRTAGYGTITPASAVTDANGRAVATLWYADIFSQVTVTGTLQPGAGIANSPMVFEAIKY